MQVVKYEDALKLSTEYFGGDELAAQVFIGKYALRDNNGEIIESTPHEMHKRLAREFARIEAKYSNPMSEEEIYNLLSGFKYIVPQGSPMSAIGNSFKLQSLSNCFVIESPQDSYGGILYSDQEQAQIMKRRGGVGFDISTIRPRGLPTANAAGTTDGIGVFMERFSNTCREVAQGGRRGALMLTISVNHPEIETFINIKRDLKKVTGANISIRLTDTFMKAVMEDSDYTLYWPVNVASIEDAKVTKSIKARAVWDQIIDAAWSSAEPGLLFWDTVKRETPADIYADKGFGSVSTNPCGEIVLSPYDSCRLLLMNLTGYVKKPFTPEASFDDELFKDHVKKAQRLMDDLIDLELEAVDKIIEKIKLDNERDNVKEIELNLWKRIREVGAAGRRTGLGITGLGDALAGINLTYGSDESIAKTEHIYKLLAVSAHESSVQMAIERGPFPAWEQGRHAGHPFFERLIASSSDSTNRNFEKFGRRNICLTTTAPAGSVSMLTQTTSGIEPAFLLSYKRRKKINPNDLTSKVDFIDQLGDKWQEFTVYHHWYRKWMEENGHKETNLALEKGSPYGGATSNDIDWVASVKLQAAAQKWVEHSLSKTCNLPNSATKETVANVYLEAWKAGCKGFTVYRDGCRTGVLVSNEETKKEQDKFVENHAPKRPKELPADIHRVNVRSGDTSESYVVIVGLFEGAPYEIFCGLSQYVEVPKKVKVGTLVKNGKKDGVSTYNLVIPVGDDDQMTFKDVVTLFDNPTNGAFTRTISLALRHGVPIQYMVEQLQKDKHSDMQSFNRVIARVLKGYIPDGTKSSDKNCTSCGAEDSLAYQEGCITCKSCGNSKCG